MMATPTPKVYVPEMYFQHRRYETRLVIGTMLAIGGNLVISVGMNIQKYSHNRLTDGHVYVESLRWWAGFTITVLGEVGNFAAYGFAPASLVAPLGTMAVISNAVIAVTFLKEKVRPRALLGIIWSLVGAYLICTFNVDRGISLSADKILFYIKQAPFLIYLAVEVVLFAIILYLRFGRDYVTVVTVLCQSALLGSLTVISAKALSSMLMITLAGNNQMTQPIFYVMLITMLLTAIGQVVYLNKAISGYDISMVMPTNFILFSISAMLAGIVFYQDFYGLRAMSVVMIILGIFLSFIGVYLLTDKSGKEESACCQGNTDNIHEDAEYESEGDNENGYLIREKEVSK